jgi:hypothetical protein
VSAYELREIERMTERAVARADQSVAAVNAVDEQLRARHEELGETYTPPSQPSRPDRAQRL